MRRVERIAVAIGCVVVASAFFNGVAGQTTTTAPAPKTPAKTPGKAPAKGARGYEMPRAHDGKPDFSGVWMAINTANIDILDHSASLDGPPGPGVVEGNELPYRPEMLERKKKNYENRATADLAMANCFLPGVPRATYMPYPFEIIQDSNLVSIRYQFAQGVRMIRLDGRGREWLEGWPEFWMGDSRGKWEGDTLVVDVRKLDERTWFDHAGNFHSDALHVVERYSAMDRDHIWYEATIEDPKVFTRSWKMSMPLYRIVDKDARVLEWDCAWHMKMDKYKDAKPK
jgi:hypothetical protein